MALAVTHVLLTIVVLDLFRHYLFGKHKFPRYWLVIGGVAGLFPDIDIPLGWAYNFLTGSAINIHGMFTHSIIFPALFLVAGFIFHYQRKSKWAGWCFVIAGGWFMHGLLDCTFGGYKDFFWPLFVNNFCPQFGIDKFAPHIDAVILVLWLVHEELHKRIRDYI